MADDVIVVDNEYITVRYVPDKEFIHHTIHKPIGDQTFKEALMTGTETLIEYGACKWLSDDRKNGPVSTEVIEWGYREWNPLTIEAGWKYWALVVPTEVVSAGSLAPTINALHKMGLSVMAFDDLNKAIAWLDSL